MITRLQGGEEGFIKPSKLTFKDPQMADVIILKNGGNIQRQDGTKIIDINAAGTTTTITAGEPVSDLTLAYGNMVIGNASGVGVALDIKGDGKITIGNGTTATSAAVSGDATLANTGALTVTGANAAFNVGTNQTWAKEVNHTSTVTTTTTAATAGGNLGFLAGIGATSGAGGNYTAAGGQGGVTGAGGNASVTSGAGGATSGVSGNVTIATGTTTAGSGSATGNVVVQSGAGAGSTVAVAAGASGTVSIKSQNGGANTGGATGQVGGAAGAVDLTGGAGGATNSAGAHAGGAGAGASIVGGAGGNASAGTGNGGAGGDVVMTAGAGGTSAGGTAGVPGMVYLRSPSSQKYTVTAMTTSATITTAAILGGLITANQAGGAAATYTMPTGAVLAAALPATFAVGDSIEFIVNNISAVDAEDATIATAASGITLKGNMTVEANSAVTKVAWGRFLCILTAGATFDVHRVG